MLRAARSHSDPRPLSTRHGGAPAGVDVMTKVFEQAHGRLVRHLTGAMPCEFAATLPDDSVDFSIYSPALRLALHLFSERARHGQCRVGTGILRTVPARSSRRCTGRPSRAGSTAVHCSDLPRTKSTHGYIGLYDFPADIRKAHEDAGWTYHSRITVWKDPVVEMQRTKALGLLYKQLQKDATRSRQGLPDYVLVFRKTPESEDKAVPVGQDAKTFPVAQWQQWASPVWMDIDQTDVLNVRAARDAGDEKHVCPLQLDLIERAIRLWSNPGDVVFSPFMGIGSEGFAAIKAGRHFLGTELKDSYFRPSREVSRRGRSRARQPVHRTGCAARRLAPSWRVWNERSETPSRSPRRSPALCGLLNPGLAPRAQEGRHSQLAVGRPVADRPARRCAQHDARAGSHPPE